MGQPYVLKLYPWERVKRMLDHKMVDMAYQFVSTSERQAKYRLVGPIRSGSTVVMGRRDRPISFER